VAIRILPVLESYRLLPQTLECLGLLRQALDEVEAQEVLLKKALSALKRDPLLALRIKKAVLTPCGLVASSIPLPRSLGVP